MLPSVLKNNNKLSDETIIPNPKGYFVILRSGCVVFHNAFYYELDEEGYFRFMTEEGILTGVALAKEVVAVCNESPYLLDN